MSCGPSGADVDEEPGSARLLAVWETAQQQGFVGRGPVGEHLLHARRFTAAVATAPRSGVDLGSGAGVPGLALALHWPESRWVLVEANQRRAAFLSSAIAALGLNPRVVVEPRRAEVVGRDASHRATHDLVVARAFGPPAVVAECGAPLLKVGGQLLVSEPPDDRNRWPVDGLARLGLVDDATAAAPGIARMRAETPCPDRFPRRVGVPTKRPLF
jgi:16S rRNA (guanine527-N7)-methyltransferase